MMGLPPADSTAKIGMGSALKTIFSSVNFYILSLLMFFFYGTLMGVGSLWAGPYLQHVFGLSKQVSSNIIMMFPLGMAFGCPLSGYLSDKVLKSRKKILLYGIILHIITFLPLLLCMGDLSTTMLYVVFFLYGLTGGTFVNCFVCVKEVFDIRIAGTAMGALNLFVFAGSGVVQNVMGVILGKYAVVSPGVYSVAAYKAAFTFCLAGLIVGTLVFFFFKERKPQA